MLPDKDWRIANPLLFSTFFLIKRNEFFDDFEEISKNYRFLAAFNVSIRVKSAKNG